MLPRSPSRSVPAPVAARSPPSPEQSGATEGQIRGGKERRAAYDREATMADQLRWLTEAGFAHVDCIYKNYLMGLFLAVKGAM